MINCAIIDDEPLAREGLASYVGEVDFLRLVGVCENPLELVRLLDEQPVDLIFLDIQMPKMSGIDVLKILRQQPLVIITTAFPTYALEGFQLNALDYLLKPITFDVFYKSASKARDYHRLLQPADDHFFIKSGTKYEKIQIRDVLFIQGLQNYVTIYTTRGKYLTLLSMKSMEEKLDSREFIRVHKSYIVSIDKIDAIEGNEIFIETHRIPISRNYRDQVIQRVVSSKLWDKIRFS